MDSREKQLQHDDLSRHEGPRLGPKAICAKLANRLLLRGRSPRLRWVLKSEAIAAAMVTTENQGDGKTSAVDVDRGGKPTCWR